MKFEFDIKENCSCGKIHRFDSDIICGSGVIAEIPEILKKYASRKVYVVADKNTYKAAGEKVCALISSAGIEINSYIYRKEELEPDDSNVGLAIMNYTTDCDLIIGVGSGVINDICKIVANVTGKPYIIVATAPSMDGYASATSSTIRDGFKISLDSKCPDVIIGDTDILKNAPIKNMLAGLGDIIAKYTAICEWRIGNLLTGEFYCEEVAKLVRFAIKKCVDNAEGLLSRDETAVAAVFEGLIISGAAMNFVGLSRPASGVEHYISHVWDMRAVEFGTPMDYHGIQCGIGTLDAIRKYEKVLEIIPDKEKALNYVANFNFEDWCKVLRENLGKAAESMILQEEKEQKYSKCDHKERLSKIIDNWDKICEIIREELPDFEKLNSLMQKIGAPTKASQIGIDDEYMPLTFKMTKDVRDKYILSRLCWDLGILEEISAV